MAKYERCWVTTSGRDVYQVFFRADEQPALLALLVLSPLRTRRFQEAGVLDYAIRWPREGIASMEELPAPLGMDSFVQLYRHDESEAKWIPQVKRLLKRRRLNGKA